MVALQKLRFNDPFMMQGYSATDPEIDFSQVSSYDSFVTGITYTLTADANVTTKLLKSLLMVVVVEIKRRSVAGGRGGSAEGTFTFRKRSGI